MKILIGVTGSISAYKAIELARLLINANHEIKVILTKGANKFVISKVFTYLGVKEVYEADSDFDAKNVLHVDLARWCDKFIIAPLSANSLSRLARGEASDLLTSVFLAMEKNKPILIFPAMNSEMLTHPFVEHNFEELKKLKTLKNLFVFSTDSGKLACNDEGSGKLLSIEEIKELIETVVCTNEITKKILITTGATITHLDPVRFLTNSSSGITGFYLAHNYLGMGYQVNVVAGINATKKLDYLIRNPNFKMLRVSTVNEMHDAVHNNIKDTNIFIASAAVADIELVYHSEKIKKDQLVTDLKIKQAKDILKSVIELNKKDLNIIGFAAETDLSDEVLLKKMKAKPVQLLVGTKVHNGARGLSVEGFNNEHANYRFMQDDKIIFEGNLSKENLGIEILKRIKND